MDEYNQSMLRTRRAYFRLERTNLSDENLFDQYTRNEIRGYIQRANGLLDRLMQFHDSIPYSEKDFRKTVMNDIDLVERVIDKFEEYLLIQGNGNVFSRRRRNVIAPLPTESEPVFSRRRRNVIAPLPTESEPIIRFNSEQTTPPLPPPSPYRRDRRGREPVSKYELNRLEERGKKFDREEKREEREELSRFLTRFSRNNPAIVWNKSRIYEPYIEEVETPKIERLDRYVLNRSGYYDRLDYDDDIEEVPDEDKIIGFGFFQRDKYKFPPKTREILEKRGNEKLGTIIIYKYLLPDISKLTKIFSQTGKVPFDDIFHLGMAFNNLRYDKDSVITLKEIKGLPNKEKLETLRIPIDMDITINEFIEKHQQKMGKERYWNYKALSWNCQDFTMNAMKAIGKWNSEVDKFVMQDPQLIKKDLPPFASSAANFLNELKLIINRRIEGEGKTKNFKFEDFVIYY